MVATNPESSIAITLPDGSNRNYPYGVTGLEIAQDISMSLAKVALAIKIDDSLLDLNISITADSNISIITDKSPEGLEIIRHDTAHILAQAVKELYPEVKVAIGPAIADGFYYDFAREKPFTPDDLELIEKKMEQIVKRADKITRQEMPRDQAMKFFQDMGEVYKSELIESIESNQVLSFYSQGDFVDLCRGPHAPTTASPKAFKLTKLAGAYWRGDSNKAMLQRIYGTAWANKKDLKAYLLRLEEAEKRDHRRLGKQLDLFHIQEEAAGQVFWHHKGYILYRSLEQYIRAKLEASDYIEVKTPIMADRQLWEKSGHWEKFREHMFISESEQKTLAVKPMNCPCHVQIFKQGIKSYRDLPLRMSEFGMCHRNEPSGSLHGLMRVRGFVQDDAHIFCTEDQVAEETKLFCQMLLDVYSDLGFNDVKVKFSDRPEKRAGSDAVWDKAEASLYDAIDKTGLSYTLNPGEGAFYGPKLEFVLVDAIGREWQCGTIQVDFVLPERLDASYVGKDGQKHRPVMLHRAVLGTFERFLGILIEQYSGNFPLWLAPVQVVVATVTNEADNYAKEVAKSLKDAGVRVHLDCDNEKINYKIRQYSNSKTPLILAVGKNEIADKSVSVRKFGEKTTQTVAFEEFIANIKNDIKMPL